MLDQDNQPSVIWAPKSLKDIFIMGKYFSPTLFSLKNNRPIFVQDEKRWTNAKNGKLQPKDQHFTKFCPYVIELEFQMKLFFNLTIAQRVAAAYVLSMCDVYVQPL